VSSSLTVASFSELFQELMKRKYVRGYRRVLPALLDALDFRAEGWAAPLVEALSGIRRELGQKRKYFEEPVPIQGIVTRRWQWQVFETVNGEQRVAKHFYEICVLDKLNPNKRLTILYVEHGIDQALRTIDVKSWMRICLPTTQHEPTARLPPKCFIEVVNDGMESFSLRLHITWRCQNYANDL
jgi:hypothetical protein